MKLSEALAIAAASKPLTSDQRAAMAKRAALDKARIGAVGDDQFQMRKRLDDIGQQIEKIRAGLKILEAYETPTHERLQ